MNTTQLCFLHLNDIEQTALPPHHLKLFTLLHPRLLLNSLVGTRTRHYLRHFFRNNTTKIFFAVIQLSTTHRMTDDTLSRLFSVMNVNMQPAGHIHVSIQCSTTLRMRRTSLTFVGTKPFDHFPVSTYIRISQNTFRVSFTSIRM